MTISFSGNASVNASVVGGTLTFPTLTGASNTVSVRTRIREAIAYGVKNTISKSNGYFNDIGEVFVNTVANTSGRSNYPSIDILWVKERYTNNVQGGNSLGGYNKIATVFLDCYLFAEKCKDSAADIVTKRENIVADIEKYFGTNFIIPDSNGDATAFNSIVVSNVIHGIDATAPKGSVEIQLEVYYRIELTDPTQDF